MSEHRPSFSQSPCSTCRQNETCGSASHFDDSANNYFELPEPPLLNPQEPGLVGILTVFPVSISNTILRSIPFRIGPVSPRRFQDRTNALVARAIATQDSAELEDVIRELREALHEHAKSLRKLAAEKLAMRQKA